MLSNVLDRKETLFGHKKNQSFKLQKNRIFPKGLTLACFCSKNVFFSLFVSVKIRLQIMF